ncbi:hypothetical protein [Flavobacterium sp.]|uniref:hypothetical protein n=1 Tax=Flavobacterium sp. TaxID=239 RepID=UPI0038D00A7E
MLSAQVKLTKEEKARREKNIKAGNPFVKYGCKAPVATLSIGKYLEVHDLDSIVIIGSTRWQVDKKIIVGEIKIDSLNADAQPLGDAAGIWMSPDPLSEEYPNWSPYSYTMDNPINLIDPDGRDIEPARNQAGTIQESIKQCRDKGLKSVGDIMRYIQSDKNAIRYVYTEKNGWIDLQHYYATIIYGKVPMDALEPASGNSILQKYVFGEGADKSYYSYEDLPSNKFGSEANIYKLEYRISPNGKYKTEVETLKTGEDLYKSIEGQFKGASARKPENAPNYNQIPFDDQDRNRLPENYTPKQLNSGEYVPQNHTSKPYNLKNFPAANTSLDKS